MTSGAFAAHSGMSLVLCALTGVAPGEEVDVMILGRPHRGVVLAEPPFDADGVPLRG